VLYEGLKFNPRLLDSFSKKFMDFICFNNEDMMYPQFRRYTSQNHGIDYRHLGKNWIWCDIHFWQLWKKAGWSEKPPLLLMYWAYRMNLDMYFHFAKAIEKIPEVRQKLMERSSKDDLDSSAWNATLNYRNEHVNQELLKCILVAGIGAANPRTIAVFYGAAHMLEIAELLESQRFKLVDQKWYTAINK
jgi:hypothetical protein